MRRLSQSAAPGDGTFVPSATWAAARKLVYAPSRSEEWVMDQKIRFTTSRDGTRIAYAESGSGTPLVKAPNWLSHLEFDWESPVWRHWFRYLSGGRRLLRFDARGCGLSDWNVEDLSLEAQVADLEAVVDVVGVERFPLLGISQGGVVAIAYTLRHPERVSHLVLYGTRARGWFRTDETTARQARSLFSLIEAGWAQDNPAFRHVFTTLFIPEATAEQEKWFDDLMRLTSKPAIATRILQSFGETDVRGQLGQLRVPTLVLHCRRDACIPFGLGRELAAGIPGAEFVELDSRNHILLEPEPAWARFRQEVSSFLGEDPGPDRRAAPPDARLLESLTTREREVLELVARGLGNGEIAKSLFISEKTVRNHLTNIFDKLDVDSRARAIVLARDLGLAGR
jgi:pimeloyl-ACP methyl ester carboxylesterase/DNA-binding CsgD family transcriptional regulator